MKYVMILLITTVPFWAKTQSFKAIRIFDKGQWDIQGGVGLFPTYVADRVENIILPASLTARWMTSKNVSLGIFTGYSLSRSRRPNALCGSWYNHTYFLGLQTGFHYTKIDNWDLFGGFSLAYQHIQLKPASPDGLQIRRLCGIQPQSGKMVLTAFIEIRFAFTPRYTVFANLGYGISILQFGIGYKLV